MSKIKKILVSQPKPITEKSPYFDLAEDFNLKLEFRPFNQIEGISAKEFRQMRIDILAHTAVIFNSRTAIDHFFRICEELRITIPDSMKYFCVSEAIAHYLQKYIVYRKRKIFYGDNDFKSTIEKVVLKHSEENFLIPLSDVHKADVHKLLDKYKLKYTKAIFYRTVSSNMSDIKELDHDMLVFYSPAGVKSLFDNFPNFVQNNTKIGCFGLSTAKAIKKAGLRLDVHAPNPKASSMPLALEQYIKENNKNNHK